MLELELKLEFEPADRQRLVSAIAPAPVPRARRLVTTYFDTPARDLLKAGYSLRVRQSGKRYIQTVKGVGGASAGLFTRQEWELPLANGEPVLDAGSGPIVRTIDARALSRMQPAFVTDVRRRSFRISGPNGEIEFAIDEGEIRAGDLGEALAELELEHHGGPVGYMFDLARQLNERVPLRLGVRSKAERGYALMTGACPQALKAEPIMLDGDGDARDAFSTIAHSCIRHFRLNEALLPRSGDAEAVHQARVALRRLRSALSICAPLLGKDSRMTLLRAELRWLAGELGEVRNLDVLMDSVDDELRNRLAGVRHEIFEHVRVALSSSRTRLLMIDLIEWLAIGRWRTAPTHPAWAHNNIARLASSQLETSLSRLKHDGKGIATLDDRHRHKVRIDAKKLRYAAEFFESLYGTDKARRRHGRFIDALEALQDALGELNDLVVGPKVAARHGIDIRLPKTGKRRKRLLAKADDAYDELVRAKPFW